MIALSSDCLLFKTSTGEAVPYLADMISIELSGDAAQSFDADFIQQATKAVFHYFKFELRRQTVSVGEFAEALQKVLRGFKKCGFVRRPTLPAQTEPPPRQLAVPFSLYSLASEAGEAGELLFFPKLREQLRTKLSQGHNLMRFTGLRGCVKQLTGARRWSRRCRQMEDQIVSFLRSCLTVEAPNGQTALVVE